MTKEVATQLYNAAAKLMKLLEDEITILEMHDGSAIKVKRSITETLNKLVSLLGQLNKLSKEEKPEDGIGADDQMIIDEFIAKRD